ncbi:MAG: antitoxin Xre/MbcA/ParS toxin-binding domain-containing protein [Anditalea sp.]
MKTFSNQSASKKENKPVSWKIMGEGGQVLNTIKLSIPSQYFFPDPTSMAMEEKDPYGKGMDFMATQPMFDYLGFSQQDVAEVMEVDPSTLFRWKKEDRKLSKLLTKAMMDMDRIIAKGVRIFGSEEHFSKWLYTVNYALGDQKPIDMMKDPYGLELVDSALEAISWGNFV